MKDQDFEQSVVEFDKDFVSGKFGNMSELVYVYIRDFILSKLKLQREKDREDIFKYLENNYIKYCKEQNGMPYCKNCGLDLVEMENDLDKLNSKK